MAEQSTPGKPADTCIEGATNDVAITGMTRRGSIEQCQGAKRNRVAHWGQRVVRLAHIDIDARAALAWRWRDPPSTFFQSGSLSIGARGGSITTAAMFQQYDLSTMVCLILFAFLWRRPQTLGAML